MAYTIEDDTGIDVSFDEESGVVTISLYDTFTMTRTVIDLEFEDAGLLTDMLIDLFNRFNTGEDFDDDND